MCIRDSDRPNPNNFYIDGPVLKKNNFSFLGMHPVPIVYGMTIGEYALMINGENWLENGIKTKLDIIKIKNYNHNLATYLQFLLLLTFLTYNLFYFTQA